MKTEDRAKAADSWKLPLFGSPHPLSFLLIPVGTGNWTGVSSRKKSNSRPSPWVQTGTPGLYLSMLSLGPRDSRAWRETVPGNPDEIQDLGDGVPLLMKG